MDRADVLACCELLEALDRAAIDEVADVAEDLSLRRNEVLFREGEPADALFVVESGRMAIVKHAPDGRASVMALMEAGDAFGEIGLFDGGGRSADARALEACTLLAVPYDALRRVLAGHPASLWALLGLLARRMRATDDTLADTVFLDVPGRTAKRLLELAGGADDFELTFTQEDLASMVGASRERVNKAIAMFVRLGWIEQADRRYRIAQREELARRAR